MLSGEAIQMHDQDEVCRQRFEEMQRRLSQEARDAGSHRGASAISARSTL